MDPNTRSALLWGGGFLLMILAVFGGAFLVARQNPGESLNSGTPLSVPVAESDLIKGNPKAPVTLVEYADFECPACQSMAPLVKLVGETYGDRIAIVYRHFPLDQHTFAKEAAYASEAAHKQGKFWEMYDKLFETQHEWTGKGTAPQQFEALAQELGLNMDQFKSDRDSDETKQRVEQSYQSGVTSGVQGTPTFFLQGKMVTTPRSLQEFSDLIDKALANPSSVEATTSAEESKQ